MARTIQADYGQNYTGRLWPELYRQTMARTIQADYGQNYTGRLRPELYRQTMARTIQADYGQNYTGRLWPELYRQTTARTITLYKVICCYYLTQKPQREGGLWEELQRGRSYRGGEATVVLTCNISEWIIWLDF